MEGQLTETPSPMKRSRSMKNTILKSEDVDFYCALCNKIFKKKKYLNVHLQNIHQVQKAPCKEFKCEFCEKIFQFRINLKKHLQDCDKNIPDDTLKGQARKSRLICPYEECEEVRQTFAQIRSHLSDEHNIQTEYDQLSFASFEEFMQWKKKYEEDSFSSYVIGYNYSLATGETKRLYNCHRSFKYISKGTGKRMIKGLGSNKTGKVCPSVIEVKTTSSNKCEVKFWRTHVGHSFSIGRINLPKETRAHIAGKLAEGVPFQHILDVIRDEQDTDAISRLTLLDRKDMHNIVRDFKLDCATKRHSVDAVSIQPWVEEMRELGEDNPVLYYKGQNDIDSQLKDEDFALVIMTNFQAQELMKFGKRKICIDGTNGTNAYDIQLYTLMTIDEFGSRIPVAFLFSNRSDQEIFKIFFKQIKSKVGVVSSSVFMSDDAPAFFDAWVNVMDDVPHKLLCTWHVERNWRQNLSKVKGGTEKKAFVYEALRKLLKCTSVEKFNASHEQVLNDLLSDSETHCFGQYFQTHYSNRPECWAYCHRIGLGINTNMDLEFFHKLLKYFYLDGKNIKHLDKTVDTVMKMARDYFYKRLMNLSKNTLCEKSKQIHNSHKHSEQIDPQHIQIITHESEWLVSSSSNAGLQYRVVKVGETCAGEETCLKCDYCKICVHTFRCTCTDYLIKLNICKHIHACAKDCANLFSNVDLINSEIGSINEVEDFNPIKPYVNKQNNDDEIKRKIDLILSLNSELNISHVDAELVNRKLDDIIGIYNKVNLLEVEKLKVQKKITNKAGSNLCKKEPYEFNEFEFVAVVVGQEK